MVSRCEVGEAQDEARRGGERACHEEQTEGISQYLVLLGRFGWPLMCSRLDQHGGELVRPVDLHPETLRKLESSRRKADAEPFSE